MTQRSYTRTEPQPFLRCSHCGSAVDDIVAHEAWHTFTETQLQAMQMSFAFILPSVLLSGFMFPRETMPLFIQWIGGAIPLTYFLEILRGIFLKGVSLDMLWQETLILSSFTFLICLLAVMKFRKRMD